MSPTPAVTIVTVTFRSRDFIGRCLDAIAAGTEAPVQIVVVDNDSDDGTADLVEQTHPEVEVVRSGGNLGFAKGVNLGARQAEAPYILLLNPDTQVAPGSIDLLLDLAAQHPEARVYGGVSVDADGVPDDLGSWNLPSLWSSVCFATGLNTLFPSSPRFNPGMHRAPTGDRPVPVPAISGAFQLIERRLWEQLGGLDERFFMYGEDVDWALRARAAGASPLVAPAARLIHEVGASSSSENKRVMVCRGNVTVMASHWPTPKRQLGTGLLLAGVFLRGVIGNGVRRLLGREPEASWAAAWRRRREWLTGW